MKQINKDAVNQITFFNYQFDNSSESTYFLYFQKQASTFWNYGWFENSGSGYYKFLISATTIAVYNEHTATTANYPILSLEGGTYNLKIYTGSPATIASFSINRDNYTKIYEEELQVHPLNERVAIKFNANPCPECGDVDITTLNNGSTFQLGCGGAYTCDNRDVTITHTSGATITTVAPGGTYEANDAPVIITDTDSVIYSAYPNSTFTCTIPAATPSTATTTFEFGVGMQNKQMARIGAQFTATSISTTNVSAHEIYKNNTLLSSYPVVINQNDIIYAAVTATTSSSTRSLTWNCEGIINPIVYTALTYYYPMTMVYQEGIVKETNQLVYSDQAHTGLGENGAIGAYWNNVIYGDPITGEFDLIYKPTVYSWASIFRFGLNDRTVSDTVATRWPRMRWSIFLEDQQLRIYEFSTLRATIGVGRPQVRSYKIESRQTSPGVFTIKFYYTNLTTNAWVLAYTSTDTHNGTVLIYPDVCHQFLNFATFNPPIITKI